MKGVIIAAGNGTRLALHNAEPHKVLLPVAGRSIIDYTVEAFARAGVTQLAIITGFASHAIRESVGNGHKYGIRIEFIHNPDYRLGNALSVYAGKAFTGGSPFLLSMADHMIAPGILVRLMGAKHPINALAVDFDFSIRHAEEGTRVSVGEDGLITRIGKNIADWNGIDAGVFRLGAEIFGAIDDLLLDGPPEYQISQAITRMIEDGDAIRACEISGLFWHDVDTREDLHDVREALANDGNE